MLHHVRSRLHHTPCAAARTHPAPLHEYPTNKSWPHFSQRARAKPCARMPGCRLPGPGVPQPAARRLRRPLYSWRLSRSRPFRGRGGRRPVCPSCCLGTGRRRDVAQPCGQLVQRLGQRAVNILNKHLAVPRRRGSSPTWRTPLPRSRRGSASPGATADDVLLVVGCVASVPDLAQREEQRLPVDDRVGGEPGEGHPREPPPQL